MHELDPGLSVRLLRGRITPESIPVDSEGEQNQSALALNLDIQPVPI